MDEWLGSETHNFYLGPGLESLTSPSLASPGLFLLFLIALFRTLELLFAVFSLFFAKRSFPSVSQRCQLICPKHCLLLLTA